MKNRIVYVRSIVQDENISGQMLIKLVASNTDGIKPFYVNKEDIIIPENIKELRSPNEVWKRIFKDNIDCYRSIQILAKRGIFDEEEKAIHEHNLLFDIIETMKSELEA